MYCPANLIWNHSATSTGSYFYYGNYYTCSLYIMSTDAFVPKVKPEHVISFGDAIFAFAITLMTLSIDIPDLPPNLTESELLSRL